MYALSDKDGKGVDIFDGKTDEFVENVKIKDGKLNVINKNLVSLSLPEGVKHVDCSCNKLTSLIVPQGVKHVDCSNNKLTSLIVPKGVKSIYCSNNKLTSLTLPEGTKDIYCSYNKLTSITLPQGVKSVYCSHNKLTSLSLPEGTEDIYCCNNELTSLIVPEELKHVYCSGNNLKPPKETVEQCFPSLVDLCIETILRNNIEIVNIPKELSYLINNAKYVICKRCNKQIIRQISKKCIRPKEDSKCNTSSFSVRSFLCYNH